MRSRQKRGGGHVVQITTTLVEHARSADPCALAALTKGSLNAATRSLAIAYAKRGIRVNAVSLGVIKTPMHPADSYAGLRGAAPASGAWAKSPTSSTRSSPSSRRAS